MRIDLENSPWAVVLLVALACLVVMTLLIVVLVSLGAKVDTTPLLAGMGVWSSLVVSALGAGTIRARRKNGTGDDDTDR